MLIWQLPNGKKYCKYVRITKLRSSVVIISWAPVLVSWAVEIYEPLEGEGGWAKTCVHICTRSARRRHGCLRCACLTPSGGTAGTTEMIGRHNDSFGPLTKGSQKHSWTFTAKCENEWVAASLITIVYFTESLSSSVIKTIYNLLKWSRNDLTLNVTADHTIKSQSQKKLEIRIFGSHHRYCDIST